MWTRGVALVVVVLSMSVARLSYADNYEGYTSKLEGVGLWWLSYSITEEELRAGRASIKEGVHVPGRNITTRRLTFGENPEFATYCDGKNRIFVWGMDSNGFTCKLEWWSAFQGWRAKETWISGDPNDMEGILRTIALARANDSNAAESQYSVSIRGMSVTQPNIFTVSVHPLMNGDWSKAPLTPEDARQSEDVALHHIDSIRSNGSVKKVIGYTDDQIRNLHPAIFSRRTSREEYNVKFRVRDTEVILVPTIYASSEDEMLYGEIVSTVVLHAGDSYRFAGHLPGCLRSIGPDLDSDGAPELLSETCGSSEGVTVTYTKVLPKAEPLVVYNHN